jgi:O-methyltransferase involved in polyketide biosynthesis
VPALRTAGRCVRLAAMLGDARDGRRNGAVGAVGDVARPAPRIRPDRPVTAGFDPTMPNMARVYNYWRGGKDHFPADRAEAGRLLQIYPPLATMVLENRAFLTRATTWAARRGIGQFLDLGAGLPAAANTHQVARAVNPTAKVAYVDTDPVVLAHARALLATGDGVTAVPADLTDPAAVLTHPELRAVIDLAAPAAVILGAVLHFLDAADARQVTAGYRQLVAPGSCLIVTVARYDDEILAKQLADEYTAGRFINHAQADIGSFFAGWQLIGPGLAEADTWREWMHRPAPLRRAGHVMAGVALRPT